MSIVIDVLLVIVVAIFVVYFTKMGLTKAIDIVGRQWLSLFISMATGPLISDRIKAWFLSPSVTGGIHRTLVDIVENNPNGYSISELFLNLPQGVIHFLEQFRISLPELEATRLSVNGSEEMPRTLDYLDVVSASYITP